MDAAGSERAVIFATHECTITASLFAATYPDRARGLVVCDPFATYSGWLDEPDSDERFESELRTIVERWGTRSWVAHWRDARERDWFERYSRSAIPPGGLAAEMRRFRFTDPRPAYPTIRVPTLILATTGGDSINSAENGRYLANAIPGARLVQHEVGEPPWLHWYGRADPILDEVGRFIAELRDDDHLLNRVLATILFTDIVGSTERAAQLGDAAWGRLLERSRAVTRSILARYGGREIDTAGDGFFAAFDGPGRAVRAAESIGTALRDLDLAVRAGVHTGECELIDGKPTGLTVHIGARIGAVARAGEVLVSETVVHLLAGAGMAFEDRGVHDLRGVPEQIRLCALVGPDRARGADS
jgi:class 3 adenylate cyclase